MKQTDPYSGGPCSVGVSVTQIVKKIRDIKEKLFHFLKIFLFFRIFPYRDSLFSNSIKYKTCLLNLHINDVFQFLLSPFYFKDFIFPN